MNVCLEDCVEPPDPLCDDLAKQIDKLINRDKRIHGDKGAHGLKHRFPEQINGQNGPSTESWKTHEDQIKGSQKKLLKMLKHYKDNGCGPPPPSAYSWATRPVPKPSEWVGNQENINYKALGGAALGSAAIGYGIYRVVRFIPSLFPPLWGTIPPNIAVP